MTSPMMMLQERVSQSELGCEWANDTWIQNDIWLLTSLGYTTEECRIKSQKTANFSRISLPWLKYLSKLTAKARARERHSIVKLSTDICTFRKLNDFLISEGHIYPTDLTNSVLQKFITQSQPYYYKATLVYATRLWAEEGWLNINFIAPRHKRPTPKVEIIPEEVLHQIYTQLDLLPAPIERFVRLQIALGCRMIEMLKMPRYCLKQEEDKWYLLRWIAKTQQWKFYQVHPLIAELVKEQQKVLDTKLGKESHFDKLFCKISTTVTDCLRSGGRFNAEPVYISEYLAAPLMGNWLSAFSDRADLRDRYGIHFKLNSHMLRRTKASVMAYCDTEDEYIAAVLGHGSLEMLPHYRKRSLDRLERESKTKSYVDFCGRVSTYKPQKCRYEKLATLLRVNTPLGECHRPTMLGDCQHRYACLTCQYHRVTIEDLPELQKDQQQLQQNLQEASVAGQQRREVEIKNLLQVIGSRINSLQELKI